MFDIKHSAKWPDHDWERILFMVKKIDWYIHASAATKIYIAAFVLEFCNSTYKKQNTL